MTTWRVEHGDCLDLLRAMPDCSVDSICCDPPYGLSNDTPESFGNRTAAALRKIMLPNLDQVEPGLSKQIDLSGIPLDGSPLTRRKILSVGIEAWVGVPECSVDFKNGLFVDEKINARGVPAIGSPNPNLTAEGNAQSSKFLGHYVLDLRDAVDLPAGDVARSGVCQPSASGFGVAVIPTLLPGRCCPLSGLLADIRIGDNDVGSGDNTGRKAQDATGVLASLGAINSAVLGLDMAGSTLELRVTRTTTNGNTLAQSIGSKLVRTLPRASGLPAKAEPHFVRVVTDFTNRTFAHFILWLHGDASGVFRSSVVAGGFMGKKWDYDVPSVEVWAECLRVLKPGGHLLAFAGTRTQHRMAVRIEDAGFEIRDMIAWVYGSGFPKSHDVSKAIDREAGAEREVIGSYTVSNDIRGGNLKKGSATPLDRDITAPATDLARKWQGWGTALKPALEPITLARKPLTGTVAANVAEWGTGAINVDGCRIATDELKGKVYNNNNTGWKCTSPPSTVHGNETGRWPANLIHDGSPEVLAGFPDANGSKPGSFQRVKTSKGLPGGGYGQERADMRAKTDLAKPGYEDSGSAARFFFQCKDGYNEVWQDLNLPSERAASVEPSLFQQRQRAVSALSDAATLALPEDLHCVASFPEPSTTATASELKLLAEIVTETIQTIGCEFWHGSKHARLTLTQSHASCVDVQRQTGTTTITASRWKSDGSADPATFIITSRRSDRGVVASRFKYCPKASKADRDSGCEGLEKKAAGGMSGRSDGSLGTIMLSRNPHPTVKPTALMQYLCRLVTPPGGVVLDPFMGSGSTGKAAMLEGFNFIGFEREAEYVEIARRRIAEAAARPMLEGIK